MADAGPVPPELRPRRVVCVLGMHRSGTSCLAGSLEQQGLFLGDVNTAAPWNRRGNRESFAMMDFQTAILEASGGWLVPILERLDHRWENLGQTVKDRMTMPATDYYKRQGWISFDPDEQTIEMTAHILGADRLIFGSDFPHPDAFYPNFVPLMKERMAGLSAEEQRLILGENARSFYKLP